MDSLRTSDLRFNLANRRLTGTNLEFDFPGERLTGHNGGLASQGWQMPERGHARCGTAKQGTGRAVAAGWWDRRLEKAR